MGRDACQRSQMARSPSNRPAGRCWRPPTRLLLPVALALFARVVCAVDASDYLLLPTVNQGEREIDWRSGIASTGPTTNAQTDTALGMGFGVTPRWFTELR